MYFIMIKISLKWYLFSFLQLVVVQTGILYYKRFKVLSPKGLKSKDKQGPEKD